WATLLILLEPGMRKWLRPSLADEADWLLLLSAIAGHHPKTGRPSPPTKAPDGTGPRFSLLLGHADFKRCLEWLRETFKLAEPPPLKDTSVSLLNSAATSAFLRLNCWAKQAKGEWEQLDQRSQSLLAGVKACLIGADVAGSALP